MSPSVVTVPPGTDSPESDDDISLLAPYSGDRSQAELAAISVISAGIQFGWALQLSLLTPYVQTLGIPHVWASFVWLCGPISGLLVQPVVGVWSDNCRSPWGRRRPFMAAGAIFVVVAVLIIGFSADLGRMCGDDIHPASGTRVYACIFFVIGFWCLDLSNNTIQGPSRALLADLAGPRQLATANSWYSFWMAVGSVMGYATGAIGHWNSLMPFLQTPACGPACANLKAAFLLAILVLALCTTITLLSAQEVPLAPLACALALPSYPHSSVYPASSLPHLFSSPTATSMADEAEWDAPLSPLPVAAQPHTVGTSRGSAARQANSAAGGAGSGSSQAAGGRGGSALGSAPDASSVGQNALMPLSFMPRLGFRRTGYSRIEAQDEWATRRLSSRGEDGENGQSVKEDGLEQIGNGMGAGTEREGQDGSILAALTSMPAAVHTVLVVMALTWTAWFPFLLFDTDWMGREVYRGEPGSADTSVRESYEQGVREGALGLLLFSVVQGFASAAIDPLCRLLSPSIVWALGNLLLAIGLAATGPITLAAHGVLLPPAPPPLPPLSASPPTASLIAAAPPASLRLSSLAVFALMGIPFAVTGVVPYAITAEVTAGSGTGQGLSMGILNLAIVVPQVIVSLASGPWDALFGGGNEPAFLAAALFAVLGAVIAVLRLPHVTASAGVPHVLPPH